VGLFRASGNYFAWSLPSWRRPSAVLRGGRSDEQPFLQKRPGMQCLPEKGPPIPPRELAKSAHSSRSSIRSTRNSPLLGQNRAGRQSRGPPANALTTRSVEWSFLFFDFAGHQAAVPEPPKVYFSPSGPRANDRLVPILLEVASCSIFLAAPDFCAHASSEHPRPGGLPFFFRQDFLTVLVIRSRRWPFCKPKRGSNCSTSPLSVRRFRVRNAAGRVVRFSSRHLPSDERPWYPPGVPVSCAKRAQPESEDSSAHADPIPQG